MKRFTPYLIGTYYPSFLFNECDEVTFRSYKYTTSSNIKLHLRFHDSLYLPFNIDVGYKCKLIIKQ